MKTLFRTLSTLLLTVLLFSCSEQEDISAPDSTTPVKPAGAPSSLSISSISPTAAEIGDVITITGLNFGNSKLSTSSVIIMGIPVSVYISWSKTSISVIVPSGAQSGTGTVTVKLKTVYSNAVNFTLLPSSSVTIGGLDWTGANLNVSTYSTGATIPQVTDSTTWYSLNTGAWCYPNNDPVLGTIYGKLYNWYAVNDPRGLAPNGWHIPSDQEWKSLSIALGMPPAIADLPDPPNTTYGYYYGTDEGGKMKEVGTSLWRYSNTGATNSSGFTALPASHRGNGTYDFGAVSSGAMWWSSTEVPPYRAWSRGVAFNVSTTARVAISMKAGLSVRCVQDN